MKRGLAFSLVALMCGTLGVAAWQALSQEPPPEFLAIVDDADGPQGFAFSAPHTVEEQRGFRGHQLHGGYWRVRPDGVRESANHLQAAFPFFDVPAGEWEFFATWAPHDASLPPEAESRVLYTIRDGDAIHPTVQMVDQLREPEGVFAEGATWQSIGKIQTNGGLVLVVLSPLPPVDENKVRGQILADAIMMRPVEPSVPPHAPVADLSVSVNPSSPVNAVMDVIVVARNDGPDAATDVVISIDLPPGGPPAGFAPGFDCSGDGTELVCRAPVLEAGQSVAFPFSFPLPPYPSSSPVRTIAHVRGAEKDPVLSNNRHAADAEVNPAPPPIIDLAVGLEVPSSLAADVAENAVVSVKNVGTHPATDVTMTAVFPFSFTPDALPQGCSIIFASPNGAEISCDLPTLAAGEVILFPFSFIAPSNPHPDLWSVAFVRGTETEATFARMNNNVSVMHTTVFAPPPPSADLEINRSTPRYLEIGTKGAFAATVRNNGPSPATNVVVTVDLPPNVAAVDLVPGCDDNDTELICEAPSLAVGETVSFPFSIDVPVDPQSAFLRTVMRVWGAEPDPSSINNRSVMDTTVVPAGDGGGGGGGGGATGNLYISLDSTPVDPHQLLGGETGEPILRLRLRAQGEDAALSFLRFTSIDSTASSVEYLELYREGETERFAEATVGACGSYALDRWEGTAAPPVQSFCARIEGTPLLIVEEGSSAVVIIRPRMKTDVGGATSNQIIRFGIAGLGSSARALGSTSGLPLAANDSDGIAEGEIFLGTDVAQANRNIIDRAEHVVVLAKIASITNANPDADGSSVPTGQAPIGQFKFTAAPSRNSLNGLNKVVLSNVIFTVAAENVVLDDRGFRMYNKADATQKVWCRRLSAGSAFGAQVWDWGSWFGGSEAGVQISPGSDGASFQRAGGGSSTSSFLVECPNIDQSAVNTTIDPGSQSTFVLEANVTNAKVGSNTSSLQVSLTNFTSEGQSYGEAGSHIQWLDRDVSSVSFDWIEYPETTVKSTRYES